MNRFAVLLSAILAFCLLTAGAMVSANSVIASSSLSSAGSQTGETPLGDLIADAVKSAAKTSVAIVAAGSLKDITIPAGMTDTNDVTGCLQYPDDKIVVVELTGKQLLGALERSVEIYPQKNMGFLQVSGLKIKFDPNSPKGARINSADAGGMKLDESQKYRVAMTAPLAEGAYGYFTIWGSESPKPVDGITLSGAVSNFLSLKTSLSYKGKDRITTK